MAGLAVALVLVVGVVGLPQLMAGGGSEPTSAAGGAEAGSGAEAESDSGGSAAEPDAAPPGRQVAPTPTDAAPDGWRTEYYRDISFQVPGGLGVRGAAPVRLVRRRAARGTEGGPAPTVRLAGQRHPGPAHRLPGQRRQAC